MKLFYTCFHSNIPQKSGPHGIHLSVFSVRKYGKDIDWFLTKMKTNKPILVHEVPI
ncbi:hypothetical protein BH09BAC4_BH09BAC4_23400 [soil metagenome]